MNHRVIIIALAVLTAIPCLQGGTLYEEPLKKLQEERQKALAVANEPINRRYQIALQEALVRAMRDKDLDTVVKINAELASFVGGPASATAAHLIGTRWSFLAPDKAERDQWIQFMPNGNLLIGWGGGEKTWKDLGQNRIEVRPYEANQTKSTIEFNATLDQATIIEGRLKGQILKKLH